MPSHDEGLVEQLKQGDSVAFGKLYAKYRSRVFRFALKLVQDDDQAEDIVQETFLKAGRAIRSLEHSLSLISWLFAIARNEAYSHLRRTRRNGQAVDPEDVWIGGTILDEMIEAETWKIVQQLLLRLKTEYREVLILREYEGLSYAEIALVTGDSESSVRSRLFKARKALTKKLKPYFEGER